MANGVRVRGTCPDNHITDTTAAPKRVTAYVPCAHDGCPHKVTCRRIPRDKVATPTAENPAETPDPHRVIKVDSYDQPSSDGPAAGGIAVEPAGDSGSAGVHPAGGSDGPPARRAAPEPPAGPRDPIDVAEQPRGKRLAQRLRDRRAGRPGGRPGGDYSHPLHGH